MIKPEKLEPSIVSILSSLHSEEMKAFYFYRNASNWCQNAGYFKAAEFYAAESADELVHAKGIEDFLTQWNVLPSLPVVSKPQSVAGLISSVEQAYSMEYALYETYEDASAKIFKTGDYCVFDFLQQYRTIQAKSVAEYSNKLNMLEGVPGSKFELLMIEKKLF